MTAGSMLKSLKLRLDPVEREGFRKNFSQEVVFGIYTITQVILKVTD